MLSMTISTAGQVYVRYGLWILSTLLAARTGATDLSAVFERVNPAVVVLHTYGTKPSSTELGKAVTQTGMGSGVVVGADGKIVTASHVVQTADSIHVEFVDGTRALAKITSSEPAADLALLQLERVPKDLVVAELGDSDSVKIGHEVFVIGAPYGLAHTLTTGHISARYTPGKAQNPFFLSEFFQTDAALNRGNSGGPVFDLEGRVVGIVSYIESKSGGNEGLGFAVTANTVRQRILNTGGFWSGVDVVQIDQHLARVINLPLDYGVLVQHVASPSPASEAGIRGGILKVKIGRRELLLGGDVIVEVAGLPLRSETDVVALRNRVSRLPAESPIPVKIYRAGVFVELGVNKPGRSADDQPVLE